MASIYKRGKVWWTKYHLKGARIQQSLHTTNERVARAKKNQIEYKLATGGLALPSETPIQQFLKDFCQYLSTIRSRKSYKNDISYLRTFLAQSVLLCSRVTLVIRTSACTRSDPGSKTPLRVSTFVLAYWSK